MKVGILEIMPMGHYTLVESITEIFSSDENNSIYIFINAPGEKVVDPVFKNKKNVHIISQQADESLNSFFRRINSYSLDRLYITTLEKWFSEFALFQFNGNLSLVIHNIDVWSRFNLTYNLSNFLRAGFKTNIIYNFKKYLLYPRWRMQILHNVLSSGGKFVVLSKVLKEELCKFIPREKIDVIPFSVFNENTADNSVENRLIKISIPGMVSALRRDYFSVFDALESELEFFRNKLEIVLLGGISPKEEGGRVVKRADELISKGLRITYFSEAFIPFDEFDKQLSQSDIVLGNMNVILDNSKSIYGMTKETGFTFTLIRFAKPGICISGYNMTDELKSSVIFYENKNDLIKILKSIIAEKSMLPGLKKEARKNSLLFTPKAIYKELMACPEGDMESKQYP